MGIGTSLGAFYDDSFHHAAAQWDSKYDDNKSVLNKAVDEATAKANGADDYGILVNPLEVTAGEMEQNITDPKIMQGNKMVDSDPRNIYNDKGDIVDYDRTIDPTILNEIDALTK